MKGIRFTAAEVEWLRTILGHDSNARSRSILKKLETAEAPSTNVSVAPIEDALVAASRGKVVALDRSGYGRASVQAGRLGVTPEDAVLVGGWMAGQGWMRGPFTLLDVLNKWPSWVAKARATAPPPAVAPGLGDGSAAATAGAARPSEGSTTGRPAPGFGRGR